MFFDLTEPEKVDPPKRLLVVQYKDQIERWKQCFVEWEIMSWEQTPLRDRYDFILIGFEPQRNTEAKWRKIDLLRNTRLTREGKLFFLD